MLRFFLLFVAFVTCCYAEEKWVWGSSDRDREFSDRRDTGYNSRIMVPTSYDDYDDHEQTTKKPVASDEFGGGSDDPRVNNGFNGFGPYGAAPPGPIPPYGGGAGGSFPPYGGAGSLPPYGGNNPVPPYGGGGGVPPYGGGGGVPPYGGGGGVPPYGGAGGVPPYGGAGPIPPAYPNQNPLYPNPNKGILVGPGGPTGIIGRRPKYFGQKGNPANGILVGPGGPIDIPPGGYPGGGAYPPQYPGQFPGGFPGPYGQGGSILPYNNNVGGGGPYATEQDELNNRRPNDDPRNNIDERADKKVLKKRFVIN